MSDPTDAQNHPQAHGLDSAVRQHRIHVDWTLNITTIATLVISLVSGVWWVSNMQAQNDKRLTLLELHAETQRQIDSGQDIRLQQELTLIRQTLQRIEDKQDATILQRKR